MFYNISHPAHLDEYLGGVLGGVQELFGGGHLSQFQSLLLQFLFKVKSLVLIINHFIINYLWYTCLKYYLLVNRGKNRKQKQTVIEYYDMLARKKHLLVIHKSS